MNPEQPEFEPLTPATPKLSGPELEFQDVYEGVAEELKKNVPPELLLPPSKPGDAAYEEVKKYFRDIVKIPVAETPSPTFHVGNELLKREQLREGRLGMENGLPVVLFRYNYSTNLRKTLCLYPADGIEPEMLGKAIFWGVLDSISLNLVQTKTEPKEYFFKVELLDFNRLLPDPVLKSIETDYANKLDKEKKAAFEAGQKSMSSKISQLQNDLQTSKGETTKALSEVEAADDKTYEWKMIALVTSFIAAAAIIIIICPYLLPFWKWISA